MNKSRHAVIAIALSAGGAALLAPVARGDVNDPNFNDITGLQFNGNAGVTTVNTTQRLRVTNNSLSQSGAVYASNRQRVSDGFSTTFQFQLSQLAGDFPDDAGQVGGDGFSFIVQNNGVSSVGTGGNELGYGGIADSLAIEFDTFWNTPRIFDTGDPNGNHISIQTRGLTANDSNHQYSKGQVALTSVDMSDTNVHTVKIDYVPGNCKIYLDNLATPVLNASDPSLDLATLLALEGGSDAYVGFTAATGGGAQENHDVLSWTFAQTPEPGSIGASMIAMGIVSARRRRRRPRLRR